MLNKCGLFLKYFISVLIDNFKWCYNYFRIEIGSNSVINFPFRLYGSGEIRLGSNIKVNKEVEIYCSRGSKINIGNLSRLARNSKISVTNNSSLNFGINSSLGEYSTLIFKESSSVGNNVNVSNNCQIFSRENGFGGFLNISDNCNIGDYCILDLTGNISIGDSVALGPRCTVYTHDHNYKTSPFKSRWKGDVKIGAVKIGANSWIGSNVTILPGVNIGEGAIIAAGSVVTKNIPSNTLWAGVPARMVKELQ